MVKAAVTSYQKWFKPELDKATLYHHRRAGRVDGEAGPITIEVLGLPRCGMPDYPHPERAGMEANWPTACRMSITTSYRMALSGLTASQVESIWKEADGHWEKALEVGFLFQPENYPNTRIFAFAATLGGNVLADQYLAQNNCAAKLQGRVDTRTWSDQLLCATLTHEHGHALGISHLSDTNATMYPSIHQASLARRGAPVEPDITAAVALGYKRRTITPPPPGKLTSDEAMVQIAAIVDRWRQ